MAKNKKIEVKGNVITIFKAEMDDYISLTDIARYKDTAQTDSIIQNFASVCVSRTEKRY
ncbi:hypothetical protein [Algoriphagus sp. NG3]|uniref:hypothetical protein n=1 Tax=Algoriphagus sp. NG3 TaxID=3097546 RepID=UPI002A80324D|nr:hypothetical protein [Algoriphagus sp. NG3]WPR76016.1 hypothetical protein SLW71_01465 [Algoriphagus sp. NG3]